MKTDIQVFSHYLAPCTIYAHETPSVVYTEITHAVSVFLYDRRKKIGGVNHFLLPFCKDKSLATPQYGNAAIVGLLRQMAHFGSNREDIEAQIFGGTLAEGFSFFEKRKVKKNIKIARRMLKKYKIPVVSEDTGGTKARRIYFNTGSGEVMILKTDVVH